MVEVNLLKASWLVEKKVFGLSPLEVHGCHDVIQPEFDVKGEAIPLGLL